MVSSYVASYVVFQQIAGVNSNEYINDECWFYYSFDSETVHDRQVGTFDMHDNQAAMLFQAVLWETCHLVAISNENSFMFEEASKLKRVEGNEENLSSSPW